MALVYSEGYKRYILTTSLYNFRFQPILNTPAGVVGLPGSHTGPELPAREPEANF